MARTDLLRLYQRLGLTPIPLKLRSKKPLVKWRNGWNPTASELRRWAAKPDVNWGVRCGPELIVLDFDSPAAFHSFLEAHPEASSWPRVRTGRGFHLWLRPRTPLSSQRLDGLEVKCIGSYVVAPPSIHPSGTEYAFEVSPDGTLPEVDLRELLGRGRINSCARSELYESMRNTIPSDFALRYGKSAYPRSLCGLATKVLTRSDGKVKHLLSLCDWKWDCPKCAPLLKRHWLEKLRAIPFRFILRLPDMAKPTTFLRRIGKPQYVHIVANGESWLFLLDGEAEAVWAEARTTGYELVVGDIAGDPTLENIKECLDKALCQEEEPLNTRRKVTHSRGLFKRASQCNDGNESSQQQDCKRGKNDMEVAFGKEPLTWESKVVMKPINEVVREYEAKGWRILWKSEVEALAIKDDALCLGMGIVGVMEALGIRLKKTGKEYIGLCPFHDDHDPSLSVNREKNVWHCFGCGKGGDIQRFIQEWQNRRDTQ